LTLEKTKINENEAGNGPLKTLYPKVIQFNSTLSCFKKIAQKFRPFSPVNGAFSLKEWSQISFGLDEYDWQSWRLF